MPQLLHRRFFVLIVILISVSVQGAEILGDSFSLAGGRADGVSLDGFALETGGVSWDVSSTSVKFTADGAIQTTTFNFIAKALLPDLSSESSIDFQVDVLPATDTGRAYLGFGGVTANGNWQEGIRFALYGNGTYVINYNPGALAQIDSGVLPGAVFNDTGYNTLKLRYNPQENTLSAWVNDELVLQDYDLDTLSFTPSLGVAGFSAISPTADFRYDNFSVTTPAATGGLGLFLLTSN